MIAMLNKIGRLFTIKTRTEAWLVTYAIAAGAVERARAGFERLIENYRNSQQSQDHQAA